VKTGHIKIHNPDQFLPSDGMETSVHRLFISAIANFDFYWRICQQDDELPFLLPYRHATVLQGQIGFFCSNQDYSQRNQNQSADLLKGFVLEGSWCPFAGDNMEDVGLNEVNEPSGKKK
jgi:phage I-like protein